MKKTTVRILSLLLAIVIMVGTLPYVAPTNVSAALVITGKTNVATGLYTEASTSSAKKATISSDSAIQITSVSSNAKWAKVKTLGAKTGYVLFKNITLNFNYTARTNTALRTGKGATYSSLGTIVTGKQITVIGTGDPNWYRVKTASGKVGYVRSGHISPITVTTGNYKITNNLIVRSKATAASTSKGTVPKSLVVSVTSVANPLWYAVKFSNGTTGYLQSAYLTKTTEKPSPISKTLYVTTVDELNVRSGAGTNYSPVTYLAKDTIVSVISTSNSQWYQVKIADGRTGYISSQFLKKVTCTLTGVANTTTPTPSPTATPSPSPSNTSYPVYTASVKMYVRSGPGENYNPVATIPAYFKLYVTSTSNSTWYKVKISDGTVGYAKATYLTKNSAGTKPTAISTNMYITTTAVQLRTGAGTNYASKGVVSANVILTVTNKTNAEWYAVKLADGNTGYIYSAYLSKVTYERNPSASTDPTPTPSPSSDGKTFYSINESSGLNLRSGPSTSNDVITVLSYGTVVVLVEKTNSSWYKVKTANGTVGYLASSYLKLSNATAYREQQTNNNLPAASSSITLPKYKSYYIGSSYVYSSDVSVATVKDGFVYGVGKGQAIISTGSTSVKVTVGAPEAVRFSYSSPNTPVAGTAFSLVAITDTAKSAVKFQIVGGSSYTVTGYTTESNPAKNGFAANSVRVWKESLTLSAGSYTVRVYSKTGSTWSTDYYSYTIHVGSSSTTAFTSANHYASDKILKILSEFEGYVPCVEDDALASGNPTLGYGHVVYKKEYFYNNLTKTEAYAMLVDTVNKGAFTTSLNNFVSSNSLKINQREWDALLSFSYNVGTGWISSSGLKTALLNNYDYSKITASTTNEISATTILKNWAYVSNDFKSTKYEMPAGQSVKVIDKSYSADKGVWYHVKYKTSSGTTRTLWMPGNLKFTGIAATKNLKYTDSIVFANNMLAWHIAGGNCIAGLLYRRLAESKIYLFGEYASASHSSANYKVNTYNFAYPSCNLAQSLQ